MRNTASRLAAALAFALAFASCSGDDDNNPEVVPVVDVSVYPTSLSLTVGSISGSVTATLDPTNATDKNVTWASDNTAIATVAGNGLVATVTPVGEGKTDITVTTRDGNRIARCALTVTPRPGAVTKLLLPKAASVKSAGGRVKLTADLWPLGAANRNVTWTSSNGSIAAVVVSPTNSLVATVTGGAEGSATITATSQDTPSIKAQCVVTVAQTIAQDVYVGGEFGMIKNGVLQGAYSSTEIHSIFVDPDGALHAAGRDYNGVGGYQRAIYLKDGMITILPCRQDAVGSAATAMHVTDDGHVHIVGYETTPAPDYDVYAKLWIDGVDVPLDGLDELGEIRTEALGVFAHGGNVYVAGHQYIWGDPESDTAVLWVNQAKTEFRDIEPLEGYADCVTALGGDVYVGGVFGLMKLAPADPLAYRLLDEYISHSPVLRIQSVLGVRMAGEDIHASGWMGNDPVYWLNHAPVLYPWSSATLSFATVEDTALAYDGSLYAAGNEVFLVEDMYPVPHPALWKDGVRQAFPNIADSNAFCIFVR